MSTLLAFCFGQRNNFAKHIIAQVCFQVPAFHCSRHVPGSIARLYSKSVFGLFFILLFYALKSTCPIFNFFWREHLFIFSYVLWIYSYRMNPFTTESTLDTTCVVYSVMVDRWTMPCIHHASMIHSCS